MKIASRNALWFVLALCSLPAAWAAPIGIYQHGTVVRMRMADCAHAHHALLVALGGQPAQLRMNECPEYTLVSEQIVFVIVGRSSGQLVPLADVLDFRIQNKELAVRVDDARHETKFNIKEMILRSEWDLVQRYVQDQMSSSSETVRSLPTGFSGETPQAGSTFLWTPR